MLLQLVLVAAAHAGDQNGAQLSTEGRSPPVCTFSSAFASRSSQNMAFAGGSSSGATISIPEMTEATSATLKPASMLLSVSAVCNVGHQVTLTSTRGALVPEMTANIAQGDFLDKIRYRAVAEWGADAVVLAADSGTGPSTVMRDIAGPRKGDLRLQISVDGSNNDLTIPVLAGTYSDSLILTISARF